MRARSPSFARPDRRLRAQPWTAVVDRRPPALWRASRVSRQAVAETPNETRCVVGRRFRPAADASDGSRTRSNEPRREKTRTMVTPFPEVYRRPACVPGAAAKGRSLRQSARFTGAANNRVFSSLKLESLSSAFRENEPRNRFSASSMNAAINRCGSPPTRKSVRTEVPPPPDASSFARAAVRHTWTRGDVTERTSVATELRRRPSVLGLRAARERVNRR